MFQYSQHQLSQLTIFYSKENHFGIVQYFFPETWESKFCSFPCVLAIRQNRIGMFQGELQRAGGLKKSTRRSGQQSNIRYIAMGRISCNSDITNKIFFRNNRILRIQMERHAKNRFPMRDAAVAVSDRIIDPITTPFSVMCCQIGHIILIIQKTISRIPVFCNPSPTCPRSGTRIRK